MAVTDKPSAPAARAAVELPRKHTLKSATESWVETTRAIAGLKIIQADAAKFLLAKAEKTGKRTFADQIAVVETGGQLTLDQQAVKDALGDVIAEDRFWKRAKRGLSLKLLK